MWYYGRQTVFELLNSGRRAKRLLISRDAAGRIVDQILSLASQMRIPCERVPLQAIDALAAGNHQGVALDAEPVHTRDFKTYLDTAGDLSRAFFCLLDEIQDPQNLGAILRSALAFGCTAVVLPKWRSAALTEAVLRASSGAAAHLPVLEISNLGVAIERLKENKFWICGTDVEKGEPLHQAKLDFPLALVLGNEQRGLKPMLKKSCDRLLYIPQTQAIDSLNVSAAAAVFFYEIRRQLLMQAPRNV